MELNQFSTEALMAELEKRGVYTLWHRSHIEGIAQGVGLKLSEEQISEVVRELSKGACFSSDYDIVIKHCIMDTFFVKARYWVLGRGYDCDGYNSGHIRSFASEEKAQAYADNENEFSDGIIYEVTEWRSDVKDYCDHYGMDFDFSYEYTKTLK